jgi:hypothetical protein
MTNTCRVSLVILGVPNGESCGSSVTNSWWHLLIFHCHLQPEMFPTQEKAPKKAAGCQSELDPVPCPVGRPYQLIFHEVVPFPPYFPKPSYQKTTPKNVDNSIFPDHFLRVRSALISFDRLGTAQAPRCCLSNCRWPWKASACHWLHRHFQSWPVTLLP